MANYRPKVFNVTETIAKNSGIAYTQKVSTSPWGLFLLKGTAVTPKGTAMPSGAILIWPSDGNTNNPAAQITFTDGLGKYGVTCVAGTGLIIKFYGK